jgi:predicted nuclease of restriction endonuclease-like (RecB) superfamily
VVPKPHDDETENARYPSSGYGRLLADIKTRIRAAQICAGLAANRELLALYWDIGRMILARQSAEGRGAKVIDRLSRDLQNEFPGQQGFSPRNLKYMRAFAEAWPETAVVHQTGAQLSEGDRRHSEIVQAPLAQTARPAPRILQQPAAQIPWMHHCMLLEKLEKAADRLWYAAGAVEHGCSRDVLALQIDSALHLRQGKAVTNLQVTLPPPQSDLAQQITKDPYVFDFLNLRDAANERALEDALTFQNGGFEDNRPPPSPQVVSGHRRRHLR